LKRRSALLDVPHLCIELPPAIMKLMENVIIECNKAGVKTSICGQAAATRRLQGGAARAWNNNHRSEY